MVERERDQRIKQEVAPAAGAPGLGRLRELVDTAERKGLGALSAERLEALPRAYRQAATRVADLQTHGRSGSELDEARALLARAHGLLYRDLARERTNIFQRAVRFFGREAPRAIRGEWKLVAASFALIYGLALFSWFAVSRDLELAYSLSDPAMVQGEIKQLQKTAAGEPFRGNFTFGLGDSPITAGAIMTHNMTVGVVEFASGLIPPLFVYLLAVNGLMLGTYTAVAGHWGQAGAISSILWCHGVLEIQALILAGAAGLVLVRGWIAPGPWSRREALRRESARSWRLFAPTFPMLFCAGMIEAFVSPHAPIAIRIFVAVITGLGLIAWIGFGGRGVET